MGVKVTITILASIFIGFAFAQNKSVSPLFQTEEPVVIRLKFSIQEIKRMENDTVYFPNLLSYKKSDGTWDSIPIEIRARGNFRRANCFFPPLRLKIKKNNSEGTPFEGNKNLKLVVPCQNGKNYNELVVKEYICYQLNEVITPYFFNTRLTEITLTNDAGKKPKSYDLKGIFLEDDDLIAKRVNGKLLDDTRIHPLQLLDTLAVKQDFFEFMISNTDWSALQQHNIVVVRLDNNRNIPLAYDFDMSGFVDAPYATVSEIVGTTSVKQRVYRGFCRSPELFEHVRSEYLRLEQELLAALNRYPDQLSPAALTELKEYLGEFFTILKSDNRFKEQITSKCRTNK